MATRFKDFRNEQLKDPEFATAYQQISDEEDRKLAERQRLEREVIVAAKAFSEQVDCVYLKNVLDISSANAGCDLLQKTDALNKFEAENKVG